ncbi:unnamed protein product [Effrenium voratum]|nr:unnamed protein product [Effrenium voratum]
MPESWRRRPGSSRGPATARRAREEGLSWPRLSESLATMAPQVSSIVVTSMVLLNVAAIDRPWDWSGNTVQVSISTNQRTNADGVPRTRLWHGCQGPKQPPAPAQVRSHVLAAACGFFRECPGFQEDLDISLAELCSLVPRSARLSRGARKMLLPVLAWLGESQHLPLGVAGVFSDQDLRPMTLKALASASRARADACAALRLLALSRFLLCERLQQVVERWLWRSGSRARQAMAWQLLEGERKEGFGLEDFCLGLKARQGLANGLSQLPREKLRMICQAQELLKDSHHAVREHVLQAMGAAGSAASSCAKSIAACLHDECANVRRQAAKSFCQLAAECSDFNRANVAAAVAPLLSHEPGVADFAAEGLALLGAASAPLALARLVTGAQAERQAAVRVLRHLGGEGLRSTAPLLQHRSPEVRRAALRVFQGSTTPVLAEVPEAADAIGALLSDACGRVRGVAALALCRLGAAAAKLWAPQLLAALGEADPPELRDVLAALGSLRQDASWAAEAVAECFASEHWSVRRSAAEVYGEIAQGLDDSTAATHAALLARMLQDSVTDVAESAARALGALGVQGARFGQQLGEKLEDEDAATAEAALEKPCCGCCASLLPKWQKRPLRAWVPTLRREGRRRWPFASGWRRPWRWPGRRGMCVRRRCVPWASSAARSLRRAVAGGRGCNAASYLKCSQLWRTPTSQ